MELTLSSDVLYIIEALEKHGHRADVVGGCVRDFLMEKAPFDIDITTSASPEEMKRIFSQQRTVETGIKHGTLTVVLHGTPYEVTTYRVDGEYADHRHPEAVVFTESLAEDLARRDFTVNAMCYSPRHGLTDLYGGREDLEKGLIRAVGEAEKRFTEDALRILRGLRFSATLGFEIEEKTAAAMQTCAQLLSFVSAERVLVEWQKLLGGKDARRILKEFSSVLSVAIPALAEMDLSALPNLDALTAEERMLLLFALPSLPPSEREGDREAVDEALKNASRFEQAALALRSKTATVRRGTQILSHLFDADDGTGQSLLLLLHYLGEDAAASVYHLRIALAEEDTEKKSLQARLSSLHALAQKNPCVSLSSLAVNGKDVEALGYKGREIGTALERALFAVMAGRLENEAKAMLSFLAKKE